MFVHKLTYLKCHNPAQLRCLAMAGSDVLVNAGRLTPRQVIMGRPSYVNALLIQRAGIDRTQTPCGPCRQRGLDRTVFPECRHIVGEFGGCCGNCKFPDHAAWCTWGPEVIVISDDDNDSDDDSPPKSVRGRPSSRDQAYIPAGQNFAVVI
jgi:hypothetical protein